MTLRARSGPAPPVDVAPHARDRGERARRLATRLLAPHTLDAGGAVVLGSLGVAVAGLVALVASTGSDPSPWAAIARGLAVLVPIGVGLYIWGRLPQQRFGRMLVACGFVSALAALSAAGGEVPYSVGRVATWLTEVAVVLLVLAFPSGALRRPVDQVLVASIALVVAVLFLPTALMTDGYPVPSTWTTCEQNCPANAFQVLAQEPAWVGDVVIPVREALASLLFLAVTARLVNRIVTATTLLRRTLIPVLAGAVVHAVALPAGFALRRADESLDAVVTLTWLLAAGLPVVAVGFLVGAARWRLAVGSALYRLAPRLEGGADPDQVRAVVSDTLEDPTVEVIFRSDDGRWVDHEGRTTTLPTRGSGCACTVIGDGDAPAAAILHDAALVEQREFVRAVGALGVMALANERLTARVQTSLNELRSSRERILAAADDERRRIERDLHDGAQQRLVALRIKLELASERSLADNLPDAAQLRQLSQDAGDALDDVRSLAAGVYPALLVDGGLSDALNSIARRSPVPVSVAARGLGRYPQDVEAAVYFCCLEALQNAAKHAGARAVSIEVTAGDRLRFEVRDDGRGFEAETTDAGRGLTNIRDRLAAVGGDLTIESGGGRGTRIAGSIPLRSQP